MRTIPTVVKRQSLLDGFQRIVVLENGPLSHRLDLICGKDQRLFSQTQDETVDDFSARIGRRLREGALIHRATVLLGGADNLQARWDLCRTLRRSFKSGANGVLEVLARAGTQAVDGAWLLFEQLIQDESFRGVELRLRLVE